MRQATQRLLRASLDQAEGSSRPCIIFVGELRDGADAILDMHGARGSVVAQLDAGSYMIQNVGNGSALNLRYYITRNNPELDEPARREWRYIPTVVPTSRVTLVETLVQFNDEHEATFEYLSIGSRKYRSTISLNHRVITSLRLEEVDT
jgi:hypothetical protein